MAGETLKTIARTLEVLSAFTRSRPELTISDLASRLNFSRTVVTRIVATLENSAFLERVAGSSRYRVGIAACELGALYLTGNSLIEAAHSVLVELADRSGFTVYLGVRQGGDVVILSAHEGRTPVRFIWSVGDRLPMATTALGKAQLLHLSAVQLDRLVGRDRLPGLTVGSITRRTELDKQLDDYRAKQWVPAFEESFPGVYAVGAAILGSNGEPLAGVSISFLGAVSDGKLVDDMGAAVLEAARNVGRRIAPQNAYSARDWVARDDFDSPQKKPLLVGTRPLATAPNRNQKGVSS